MRNVRFLIVLALGLLSVLSFSNAKEIKDYWMETGFSFREVEVRVNDFDCYSAPQRFLGCASALKSIAGFAKPQLAVLIPGEVSESELEGTLIQASFGIVSIVQFPESARKAKKPDPSAGEDPGKVVQRLRQAWLSLYTSTSAAGAKRVPFTEIRNWLRKSVVVPSNEAWVSGVAVNRYMIVAEDAHSSLQPSAYFESQRKSGGESFTGIGAVLRVLEGRVTIARPIEGGPALKAGIHAGDIITHLEGQTVEGLELEEIVRRVKGPAGTSVAITVVRKGQPLAFTITRAAILPPPNVESKVIERPEGKFGYLKLRSFMDEGGCTDLKEGVRNLTREGVAGLIFDLRGNPGGSLPLSVCIANIFVPRGSSVVEVRLLRFAPKYWDLAGKYLAKAEPLTNLPMVTLINSDSASASEIVSGALQDYGRSVIVGERSFGKGSVQNMGFYDRTKLLLKGETIARFYRPSGRTNQVEGITPDITVYSSPDPTPEQKRGWREEDEYPNALPPEGPAWAQPRPDYIRMISGCVKDFQGARNQYQEHLDDAIPPDYQLFAAEDVLACSVNSGAVVSR